MLLWRCCCRRVAKSGAKPFSSKKLFSTLHASWSWAAPGVIVAAVPSLPLFAALLLLMHVLLVSLLLALMPQLISTPRPSHRHEETLTRRCLRRIQAGELHVLRALEVAGRTWGWCCVYTSARGASQALDGAPYCALGVWRELHCVDCWYAGFRPGLGWLLAADCGGH